MSTYQHACSAAGYDTCARLVEAVVGAIVRWYRFRRSLGILRRLDGRTLQDLGFERDQIPDVVLTANRHTANA